MTIYTLSHGPLKLDVSDRGGVIEGFWRDATPLLRPGKKRCGTDASCFPLVPFANRVSGNRFVWQGREYQLQPNVEWDAHYLHGDGWLGQWQCVSRSEDSLCLVYEHRSGVYHYRVSQAFHLTADTLTVTLSVNNQGQRRCHLVPACILIFRCHHKRGFRRRRAVIGWSGSSGWRVSFASNYRRSWISTSSRRCRASG